MTLPHPHQATAILKELTRRSEVDFEFWGHADREMRKDGLDRQDVLRVLTRGYVKEVQLHGIQERFVIVGKTVDGADVTVVAILCDEESLIEIVTIWVG